MNRLNRKCYGIVTLFGIAILAGCSGGNIKMYQGQPAAQGQVAYLDSSGTLKTFMSKSAAVIVKRVNSMDTNMEKSAINPRLELLPGKHTLEVQILRSVKEEINSTYGTAFKEYSFDKTLSFVAKPGRTYHIYGVLDEEKTFPWFAWIEDKSDDKVVAGEKPAL